MLRGLFICALTILVYLHWAHAEELDKYSKEALEKTQNLLTDKSKREEAVQKDEKAKSADQNLKNVMGNSEMTQEAYELAADIFKDETNKNGGDVKRMTDSIQEAGQDPAGWAARLKPEQLEKIKQMAREIEARQQKMIHNSD